MTGWEEGPENAYPNRSSELGAYKESIREAQRSFDKQHDLLSEIDDKAMRTVRTAVVLVGITVSAVGISGPENLAGLATATVVVLGLSLACLLATVIVGTATYQDSDGVPFGISHNHVRELRTRGYSNKQWHDFLLDEYKLWSDRLERINEQNSYLLSWVQVSLLVGVLGLLTASVMVFFRIDRGFPPEDTLLLIVAGTMGVSALIMTVRAIRDRLKGRRTKSARKGDPHK